MTLEWCDDEATAGLSLEVRARRGRPWWRVEAAAPYLFRLCAGRRPFLWARVDPYWSGADFVREAHAAGTWVVPAIDPDAARAVAAAPRTPAWWRGWAEHFARALDATPRSPLFDGTFRLAPLAPGASADAAGYPCTAADAPGSVVPPPHGLAHADDRAVLLDEHWFPRGPEAVGVGGVFAARGLTAEDRARVHAWRRSARDGALPPVLLAYVHVLGKHVVLDGHARLAAALQAGVEPPLLGLWPVRVNGTSAAPVTRAWPIAGGPERWTREVRARLCARGGGVPAALANAVLAGLDTAPES